MISCNSTIRLNKSLLWMPMVYIVAFTYLYPISVHIFPVSTDIVLHAVSIAYLILFKRCVFSVDHYRLSVLSITIIILSIFFTTINGAFDFSLVKKFIASLLFIPSSIFVVDLIKKVIPDFSEITILEWIVYVTLGQAIISLLLFVQPVLMDAWLSIMKLTDAGETIASGSANYRLIAFAKYQFANMAVMYGVALLCMITIAFSEKSTFYNNHKLMYFVTLLLICIAGILSARTFFVILLIAILYTSFLLWKKKGFRAIFYVGFLCFLIILVGTVIISTMEGSEYARTYQWMFEWLINLQNYGELGTDSTSTLNSMYIYPTQIKTWLVGDGFFCNSDGTFYMSTDAGYIRSLFYWGIIGSVIYYVLQYMHFKIIYRISYNKIMRYFAGILIFWLFVYNIKDMWQANMYWPLLLSAVKSYSYKEVMT